MDVWYATRLGEHDVLARPERAFQRGHVVLERRRGDHVRGGLLGTHVLLLLVLLCGSWIAALAEQNFIIIIGDSQLTGLLRVQRLFSMQDRFHKTILCLIQSAVIFLLLLTASSADALSRFFLLLFLAAAHGHNHVISDAIVLCFGTFLLGC